MENVIADLKQKEVFVCCECMNNKKNQILKKDKIQISSHANFLTVSIEILLF